MHQEFGKAFRYHLIFIQIVVLHLASASSYFDIRSKTPFNSWFTNRALYAPIQS